MSKVRCAWRKLTGLHFERRRRLNSELPQSPEEAIARGCKYLTLVDCCFEFIVFFFFFFFAF